MLAALIAVWVTSGFESQPSEDLPTFADLARLVLTPSIYPYLILIGVFTSTLAIPGLFFVGMPLWIWLMRSGSDTCTASAFVAAFATSFWIALACVWFFDAPVSITLTLTLVSAFFAFIGGPIAHLVAYRAVQLGSDG
jgi:uncharacterized membrane protein YfcA